jgi:hypothetical protein
VKALLTSTCCSKLLHKLNNGYHMMGETIRDVIKNWKNQPYAENCNQWTQTQSHGV